MFPSHNIHLLSQGIFFIVKEIISDMLRQKVNLPELDKDGGGSVAKFPQNFGPETRMLLKT